MRIFRIWFSGWGVLLLLVLLVAVNVAYAAIAQNQTILTGQAGDLLYAAGFDGFFDEWQQSAGRDSHQIVDGVMRVNVQTSTVVYAASKPIYSDFDASVTVRTVGGAEANDGVGLIFRLQEPTCDQPLPLMCDLAQVPLFSYPMRLINRPESHQNSYYLFLVSSDGFYKIGKYDAAKGGLIPITVWHDGGDLVNKGLNVDNRIRVVGRGDQFQFFINGQALELCVPNPGEQPTGSARECQGQRVNVWQNDEYKTGKLGVVVNTEQNVGTVADFDAFTVTMPREANATPGAEI